MRHYYSIILPLGACIGWVVASLASPSHSSEGDWLSLGMILLWAYVGVKLDEDDNES